MKTTNPRILILDVHGPYEPWLSILNDGQLKTWAVKDVSHNVEIIHVMGNSVSGIAHRIDEFLYSLKFSKPRWAGIIALCFDFVFKKIIGNIIFNIRVTTGEPSNYKKWVVQMPDFAMVMGNKMISAFKFALENSDFDYLGTTITSTYLNTDKLSSFAETLPRRNLLAGNFITRGSEHFQQGAFRLYSRDVIEYIVKNRKKYEHWALEDVAMGRLLKNQGFEEINIPNLTIKSLEEFELLDSNLVEEQVYFRCKGVTRFGNKVRGDVEILMAVHHRISGSHKTHLMGD